MARIAGAMDPATRTVAVEVRLPNKDGMLIPGMYAQVKFDLPQVTSVRLPTAALLSGTEGTRIALVTAENKVHFVPVKVGRDFGSHHRDSRRTDRPRTGDPQPLRLAERRHDGSPDRCPGSKVSLYRHFSGE